MHYSYYLERENWAEDEREREWANTRLFPAVLAVFILALPLLTILHFQLEYG